MSVAAVMLVKDEADIVEYVVRYLFGQVDHVIVCDNGSTDGTREKLDALHGEVPATCAFGIRDDPDPAYYQAEKTTALAAYAHSLGHQWVVPCDADELWYATDGRTISAFLGGLAPDVAYANAPLYNHLPTVLDPPASAEALAAIPEERRYEMDEVEPNPFRRIGWRQREHGALPKVAARLRPGLEIRQGNHAAYAPGGGLSSGGLVVRHFSWRSEEQYARKIANGAAAYAATDLPANVGEHWRAFGFPPDLDRAREWFRTWGWQDDPYADSSLIFDPAPWRLA